MKLLKLTKIGDSVGVVLPEEVLLRFDVSAGDSIFIEEVSSGYLLTAHGADLRRQMTTACDVMRRRREALRELSDPHDD